MGAETVETKTVERTKTEVEEVELVRCTGPCEEWREPDELAEVTIHLTGEPKRVVCIYCIRSMWGEGLETDGVDIRGIVEMSEALADIALRGAIKAIGPILSFGLVALIVSSLGDSVNKVSAVPSSPATDPVMGELFVTTSVMLVILIFLGAIFTAAVRSMRL